MRFRLTKNGEKVDKKRIGLTVGAIVRQPFDKKDVIPYVRDVHPVLFFAGVLVSTNVFLSLLMKRTLSLSLTVYVVNPC